MDPWERRRDWHREGSGSLSHFVAQYGSQVMVLAVLGVACVAVALIVRHHQARWPFGLHPAPSVMAAGSALGIAVVTLTPLSSTRSPGRLQLHPLATIHSYAGDTSALVIYLLGNVAFFVPLGFFLYLAVRRGIAIPFALTAVASVTVEILQLPIWSRSTDVDDVLLNSIGGLIGVLAGAVVLAVLPDRPPPVLLTGPREPATASGFARRTG